MSLGREDLVPEEDRVRLGWDGDPYVVFLGPVVVLSREIRRCPRQLAPRTARREARVLSPRVDGVVCV